MATGDIHNLDHLLMQDNESLATKELGLLLGNLLVEQVHGDIDDGEARQILEYTGQDHIISKVYYLDYDTWIVQLLYRTRGITKGSMNEETIGFMRINHDDGRWSLGQIIIGRDTPAFRNTLATVQAQNTADIIIINEETKEE